MISSTSAALVQTLLHLLICQALSQVEYCDLYPPKVAKCIKDAQYHPVNKMDASVACIQEFYVDLEPDLNITKEDRAFFDLRAKNGFGLVAPPSGFRIRKEYRRLTKDERIRLHVAFNELYKRGILHKFGRLHATASRSIHRGASFMAWHRVFIADFEEELRRVDPTVSLPYWDSTMDNNMTLPSDSVMFSACFLGNGVGTITTGPFRGFYGGRSGPLQRDYARDECDNGRLLNKNDLLRVLGKCRLQEITTQPEEGASNLEIIHDNVHTWVGGDMGDLFLSAFDPIFYFHHAFTDYIWELFRRNQALNCGVDPETDYPPDMMVTIEDRKGTHRAFDTMYGYEHLKNIDGLSHIFIKKYYKYETLPQCPDCGSEYLYCDPVKQICISKDKKSCDIAPGQNTYTGSGFENVNIGFQGELQQAFHDFPLRRPIGVIPQSDPRHRDMTHAEARQAMGETMGSNSFAFGSTPFGGESSPLSQSESTFNSGVGTVGIAGLSKYDSLFSPLTWPYALQSVPRVGSFQYMDGPHSPGYVPFQSGGGGFTTPAVLPSGPLMAHRNGYY